MSSARPAVPTLDDALTFLETAFGDEQVEIGLITTGHGGVALFINTPMDPATGRMAGQWSIEAASLDWALLDVWHNKLLGTWRLVLDAAAYAVELVKDVLSLDQEDDPDGSLQEP